MSNIGDSKYQAALDVTLARAVSDAKFRGLALSDAPAAVKEATGLDLPAGVTLRFVEFGQASSSEGSNYVIPLLASGSEDLTDSDVLDRVAGGRGGRSDDAWVGPNQKATRL